MVKAQRLAQHRLNKLFGCKLDSLFLTYRGVHFAFAVHGDVSFRLDAINANEPVWTSGL